jgi:hypothetical protein
MRFHELIQLHALKLKQTVSGGGLPDHIVDRAIESNPDAKMRQVCAMVSQELFDELQDTCQTLDISKRRFVEGALIDALEKAKQIVGEVDPFEHAEQKEGA